MAKSNDKIELYCFDASAFIRMQQFYSPELFPEAWKRMELMFQRALIFSHEIVYHEIVKDEKRVDAIGKWVQKKKKFFRPITQVQVDKISSILQAFPKLILSEQERDQADPWLIALMMELKEGNKDEMFEEYQQTEYYLVSEESPDSSIKIPAACKHFGIKHLSLKQFFLKEGIFDNMTSGKKTKSSS